MPFRKDGGVGFSKADFIAPMSEQVGGEPSLEGYDRANILAVTAQYGRCEAFLKGEVDRKCRDGGSGIHRGETLISMSIQEGLNTSMTSDSFG
jgi:hypothetical protein